MLKLLFICAGNACRSQMAEGLINHDLKGEVQAFSAGVCVSRVYPRAIQVMAEIGINISGQRARNPCAGRRGWLGKIFLTRPLNAPAAADPVSSDILAQR